MDKKILVFGSSISWGAWDSEGGWVDRLRRIIHHKVVQTNQQYYCMLYNQSISGDTSSGLLERFEGELVRRHNETDQDLMLIYEVGINDSRSLVEKKKFEVPLETFEKNIDSLIDASKKYTDDIVFINAPPVIDELLDPVPWLPDKTYKTEYIERFNERLRSRCRAHDLEYIDIFTPFSRRTLSDLMSTDGVHPNARGHELYLDAVKPLVETMGYL